MENKVLYNAKAANKINAIFLAVITLVIAVLDASLFIPVKKVHEIRGGDRWQPRLYDHYDFYNIYGSNIGFKEHDRTVFKCHDIIVIYIIILSVFFFISLSLTIYAFKSRKCILELNPDGIQGKVKKLFSSKSINQPFEQIDNLYIRKNIIDIITGCKTIAISSGGSKIKFSCVANAQEFVDKTLEELKKYKESVNYKAEKAVPASSGNAMDDLLKLKTLLDQGLITQEEFEKKKNGIIEKI